MYLEINDNRTSFSKYKSWYLVRLQKWNILSEHKRKYLAIKNQTLFEEFNKKKIGGAAMNKIALCDFISKILNMESPSVKVSEIKPKDYIVYHSAPSITC